MTRLAESPSRHDLVWLTAAGAASVLNGLAAEERGEVVKWLRLGRPVIRTRDRPGEPPGRLCLGLPLPPDRGKRRLALSASRGGVAGWRPPPLLAEVIDSAPRSWREALLGLELKARALNLPLRVYGSLAWQYLGGEGYLRESSDLDLLWSPTDAAQLQAGLALLQAWEEGCGLRADGEVLLAVGAVSWRELAQAPARVLVKGQREVLLLPLASVFERSATARARLFSSSRRPVRPGREPCVLEESIRQ